MSYIPDDEGKMRLILQEDMNAAAQGLRMASKSLVQLQNIVEYYAGGQLFADKVIAAAARQMIKAKRRMGAR